MQDSEQHRDGGHDDDGVSAPPRMPGREPAINLPAFVIVSALVLLAVHAAFDLLATDDQRFRAILYLAFIPARFGELAGEFPLPQARYWTPLTYSLLHGGWLHLTLNLLWMVVFAPPLVYRLGALRTLAIAIAASAGGAALHYLFHAGEVVPVVGASAVVSGYMGAAARFAFSGRRGISHDGPSLSLVQSFANRRFLAFFGIWMTINLVFGLASLGFGGQSAPIAWQAHIGGFLAGLLAFSLVERRS